MMTYLRIFTVCLALSALALPSYACSCMMADSAETQADGHEVVFIGQVIDTRPPPDPRSWWKRFTDGITGREGPGHMEIITTFQVDEALKGAPGDTIAIRHTKGEYSATCGISFAQNTTHVVLASPRFDDGGFTTSLCSGAQFSADDFRDALADD